MPKGSGPSGPSGGNAARADKAKMSRAEQSAAKDALKVVAAQARADAAAKKKAAAAAIKVSLRKPGQMPLQQEGPTSRRKKFLLRRGRKGRRTGPDDAATKVTAAQAKADAAADKKVARRTQGCYCAAQG